MYVIIYTEVRKEPNPIFKWSLHSVTERGQIMATKLTVAQKNEMVKNQAISELNFPESTIQYGSYAFAIPVVVDGEDRYAKIEITAGNNKDTKTTSAFDPAYLRDLWLEDVTNRSTKAEQAKLEKEKKLASKKSKSKKDEE